MHGHKRVPDVYQTAYFHAKEQGQDDDSARWYAELVQQQMAETPELPKPESDNDE